MLTRHHLPRRSSAAGHGRRHRARAMPACKSCADNRATELPPGRSPTSSARSASTRDQKQLLGDVRKASEDAAAVFKASCPQENAFPLTPPWPSGRDDGTSRCHVAGGANGPSGTGEILRFAERRAEGALQPSSDRRIRRPNARGERGARRPPIPASSRSRAFPTCRSKRSRTRSIRPTRRRRS